MKNVLFLLSLLVASCGGPTGTTVPEGTPETPPPEEPATSPAQATTPPTDATNPPKSTDSREKPGGEPAAIHPTPEGAVVGVPATVPGRPAASEAGSPQPGVPADAVLSNYAAAPKTPVIPTEPGPEGDFCCCLKTGASASMSQWTAKTACRPDATWLETRCTATTQVSCK